ncbi:hypothetical protein CVIRNUC_010903 [Coccomyxa viridis]|uniref:Uncharacterized protein n=1 Tax=Coccomyxa viridis TaxID=1274662 RepID=A0AAV1IK17_9CHLO|nr:hypothetical protein CVIRNUC_010903 [Coccomyxa viridis]
MLRRQTAAAWAWRALQSSTERGQGYQHLSQRGLQLFDVFNKEKARERTKEIKEEMKRGYFEDFKDLKETQGRMFEPSEALSPPSTSTQLPNIAAAAADGIDVGFPPPQGTFQAALLCIAFRAGAEDMLRSWSEPFREAHGHRPDVRWYELSLVESVVMSFWPFKQMIIKSGAQQQQQSRTPEQAGLQPQPLFSFGDATEIRKALDMTNRLTGYVYLVDSKNRIRWSASGKASPDEAQAFIECSKELIRDR